MTMDNGHPTDSKQPPAKKSIDVLVVPAPIPEQPKVLGRPTDYKDEYAEQARKLCLLGSTDKEMAKFFNVAESTLNLWKLRVPDFSESIKEGKEIADMEVAEGLNKRARGFEYVEYQAIKVKEVKYENGKRISEIERVEVVPVTKVEPPESRAASFWLKNRRTRNWRDKIEAELSGTIEEVHISGDQAEQLIRARTKRAAS